MSVTNSGGVIVPMDKELSAEEITNLLGKADVGCLVYDDDYEDITKFANESIMNLTLIHMHDLEDNQYSLSMQKALNTHQIKYQTEIMPNTLAAIIFTSGTTEGSTSEFST